MGEECHTFAYTDKFTPSAVWCNCVLLVELLDVIYVTHDMERYTVDPRLMVCRDFVVKLAEHKACTNGKS